MQALGQIYNVLIILTITLLMAVATAVLAYFVDLIPSAIDNGALIAPNALGMRQVID
jgi:hypothetical protein